MWKPLLITLIAYMLAAHPISAQGNDAGFEAFQSGDYETAIAEWTLLAEQGNIDAQFNLGNMYRLGAGVPADGLEAVSWYRMAANQGDAQAQFNLGLMYDLGDGVPQNLAQAFIWYAMAGINGSDHAETNRHLVQAEMDETQLSFAMQKAVDCRHSDYQDCG